MYVVVKVKSFLRHIFQVRRRFRQEASFIEDVDRPTKQYASARRVCFQLVSEREKERVAVVRQTIAFVVHCNTAESSPLTSFLNFLQRSEPALPIDAGPTVTGLGHGHAAEPRETVAVLNMLAPAGESKFQIRSSRSPALSWCKSLLNH